MHEMLIQSKNGLYRFETCERRFTVTVQPFHCSVQTEQLNENGLRNFFTSTCTCHDVVRQTSKVKLGDWLLCFRACVRVGCCSANW